MAYEFAIQKDILNSGEVVLTPVFREKSRFRFLNRQWQRISKVEGMYELIELDRMPILSMDECQERINGYKDYLKEKSKNNIKSSDYLHLQIVEDDEVRQSFLPVSIL